MAHTTVIRNPGLDEGVQEAWVIRHGNWSGDVELCWKKHGNITRVRIPGSVLLGLMTQHVSDEIEEAVRSLKKLEKHSQGKAG